MRNGLNAADLDRYLTTERVQGEVTAEGIIGRERNYLDVLETLAEPSHTHAKLDSHSHLILIAHSLRVLANELEAEGTVRGRAERGKARVFALLDYALELEGIR